MTDDELASIEYRKCDGLYTLQSLVPIVLVNENKVWRLGQPKLGGLERDVALDLRVLLLFLSAPTPILGGAKEKLCCAPFPYCCGNKGRVSVPALMARECSEADMATQKHFLNKSLM